MNGLDIVIVVIVGITLIAGLLYGFVRLIGAMISVPLAIIGAALFFEPFGDFLASTSLFQGIFKSLTESDFHWVTGVFAFVTIFLIALFICGIFFHLVNKLLKKLRLGVLDTLFGGFAGIFVGSLLVVLIIHGIHTMIQFNFLENTLVEYLPSFSLSSPLEKWAYNMLSESKVVPMISGYYEFVVKSVESLVENFR